jgi:hypothetical protein
MGESYAGVYIGETLKYMLDQPNRFGSNVLRRMSGVALGDACLGGDVLCGGATGPYASLMFFYGHGQLSTELWNNLNTICTYSELHSRVQSAACTAAINSVYEIVGGYYAYNLYDQCEDDAFSSSPQARLASSLLRRSLHKQRHEGSIRNRRQQSALEVSGDVLQFIKKEGHQAAKHVEDSGVVIPKVNGYWCPGLVFFTYFDRPDVRKAVAVPINSTFFNADDGEGMNYIYNCRSVMPTLLSLVRNTTGVVGRPVRVWAYDGDGDPSVNVFSTQQAWWNFTSGNDLVKTSEWRAWTLSTASNIVGGYVTQWVNGSLTYVTVRGSGHMVPEYKPVSAMVLASTFVSERGELPVYKP